MFQVSVFAVVHKPSENTRIVVKEGEPVVAKCLSDDSDVDLFTIEWNSFGTTEDPNTKSFVSVPPLVILVANRIY